MGDQTIPDAGNLVWNRFPLIRRRYRFTIFKVVWILIRRDYVHSISYKLLSIKHIDVNNDVLSYWRIYVSLGRDELTVQDKVEIWSL